MNDNNMIDTQLGILIDILNIKMQLLESVLNISENQEYLIMQPPSDERTEMFKEMTEEKQRHIDLVLESDERFQSIFDKIKDIVEANGAEYKPRLLEMQDLITVILETDVKIRAQEQKNRDVLHNQMLSMQMKKPPPNDITITGEAKNKVIEKYKYFKKDN